MHFMPGTGRKEIFLKNVINAGVYQKILLVEGSFLQLTKFYLKKIY